MASPGWSGSGSPTTFGVLSFPPTRPQGLGHPKPRKGGIAPFGTPGTRTSEGAAGCLDGGARPPPPPPPARPVRPAAKRLGGGSLRSIPPRVGGTPSFRGRTANEAFPPLSPNPPMDRDGRREDSGRGEGVTGAMIRARIWVDGRLAGGLQAFLGAPMAAYSGCGERDGGIGHGKRRSRTGLARVCGDVGLAGGSVADGRRQAGSGMARSRARARLNCSSQGQRRGRCRVNRRAERVIRPAKAKTRRLRVLVVTIC